MPPEKVQLLRGFAEEYVGERAGYQLSPEIPPTGGSAAVFKIKTPIGLRALKVYDPSFFGEKNRESELHRLALQRRLVEKEKRISSLIDVYEITEAKNTCFIEMEYCA